MASSHHLAVPRGPHSRYADRKHVQTVYVLLFASAFIAAYATVFAFGFRAEPTMVIGVLVEGVAVSVCWVYWLKRPYNGRCRSKKAVHKQKMQRYLRVVAAVLSAELALLVMHWHYPWPVPGSFALTCALLNAVACSCGIKIGDHFRWLRLNA